MRGEYRVKNRALQELFLDASRLARKIQRVTVHGRAPRAQRARGQPRQRGARPAPGAASRGYTPPPRGCSSVGRASACHAEGRGFEPVHPLTKPLVTAGFCFLCGNMCPRCVPVSGIGVSLFPGSAAHRCLPLSWQRLLALSGVAFAVLFLVGSFGSGGDAPDYGASDQDWTNWEMTTNGRAASVLSRCCLQDSCFCTSRRPSELRSVTRKQGQAALCNLLGSRLRVP